MIMKEYVNAGIFGVRNMRGRGNYDRAVLLRPCRYVMGITSHYHDRSRRDCKFGFKILYGSHVTKLQR